MPRPYVMRSHTLAALILILFVVLSLSSAAAVPLFEASDEAAHFLYAHTIEATGALPPIPTRDDLAAAAARGDLVAQWSIEAHQPPLYYALGALLIAPTSREDLADYLRSNDLIFTWGRREGNHNQWLHLPGAPRGDTHVAIWSLRLFSLALACGSLWCIYRAAHLATGSASVALTAMLTTAVIPTFAAISASVNNDNLITFLSAAAVYWTLRVMRFGLRKYDWAVIALIASAIALTKFTGLAVVAVVALGLFFAVRAGTVARHQAFIVLGAILLFSALNAGWWYVRNLELYGDPLALEATQALWGREYAVASESGGLLAEVPRIWRSFWLMIGHLHLPVWGPAWFYIAALLMCGLALAGWIVYAARRAKPTTAPPAYVPLQAAPDRMLWVLALAALLPVALLVYGTRTVDISYGRLLYPGLVGMMPLAALGWHRLLGRFAVICALPLVLMTALMPYTLIRPAYPTLQPVDRLPHTAIPLGFRVADSPLTVVGYEPLPPVIAEGDAPPLTIYLASSDPRNPALTVAWLAPADAVDLGQLTVYPGMSPTDALGDGALYAAAVPTAPLFSGCEDCRLDTGRLRLELKWQTDGLTALETIDADGHRVPMLLDGPVYVDPTAAPADASPIASFGGIVELLSASVAHQGPALRLELVWRTTAAAPPPDLALTAQIFDASGDFVLNADGDIAGYPSRIWIAGAAARDARTIELPSELPPGAYTIAVGWYTRGDLSRLPADAETARDGLAVIGTFEVQP